MATTQDSIPIKNIHDNLVILKDGSAAVVLNTSAVNFDLLSEMEQMAIIDAFAALLNSLSFAIQIVIRSKRLDISTYLDSLKTYESQQTNPLLAQLMKSYQTFIETTTRENEVLDKQFYIVIQVSYLEIGFAGDTEKNIDKTLAILLPRRDHIMRQLNRIGLKSTQLSNEELIKLFYDIYNESSIDIPTPPEAKPVQPVARETVQSTPQTAVPPIKPNIPIQSNLAPSQPNNPIPPQIPVKPIQVNQPVTTAPIASPQNSKSLHPGTPFIVEELPD